MARRKRPRILIVTPEITYLPPGMGNQAQRMTAKAGGMADVSATLVSALFEMGADVHVTMPHYRSMFHGDVWNLVDRALRRYKEKLPRDRIHLAEDRIFYYQDKVYASGTDENLKLALAFQREVINNILPRVRPDIVHCNDWMTGLVPPALRRLGIPSLLTLHNIHTEKTGLAEIEDRGIDAAEFWDNLYFESGPVHDYHAARDRNRVDLLTSGIFASHFINTVSPRFLEEINWGWHDVVPQSVRNEVQQKHAANCAIGILNAPDPSFDPRTDESIARCYGEDDFVEGKAENKRQLQERLGLEVNPDAPIFFWPSRLDPMQKGPQLLTDILYQIVHDYREQGLQVVVVASGAYHSVFQDIVERHKLDSRVAVAGFREELSHLGYAGSDFMVMPSLFEPCGLPQMISPIYGALPVAHNTGGIHDTVSHLDVERGTGNGFLFDVYDSQGLRWCVDEAMRFWDRGAEVRHPVIGRVMKESVAQFNHGKTAEAYLGVYEKMLNRPLVS